MRAHRTTFLVLILLAALWCAGIAAVPLLRHAGVAGARALAAFYGTVCHQLGGRSWHLAGEPLGVCVRCASIYGAAFLSLLILRLVPSRWGRVPPAGPLVAAGLLMAADAALNLSGLWVSTELHRAVTGGLLGALLPWYVVPLLLGALDGLRRHSSEHGEIRHVRQTE